MTGHRTESASERSNMKFPSAGNKRQRKEEGERASESAASAVSGHQTEATSEQSNMKFPSAGSKRQRKEKGELAGVSGAATSGRHSREGVSKQGIADVNCVASHRSSPVELVVLDESDDCLIIELTTTGRRGQGTGSNIIDSDDGQGLLSRSLQKGKDGNSCPSANNGDYLSICEVC